MNRSMEAHAFLQKKGFLVDSYGTGEKVKLPGPSADRPNIYEFGTTYEQIAEDLSRKDRSLYTQNGILHMLDRNRRIKAGPERLQESKEKYDLIVTAEERVYDQVLEYFDQRGSEEGQPAHVLNMDIQDNHEEATIGAFLITELVTNLSQASDLDDEIEEILQEFEVKSKRSILHMVVFY
jgi:RNA polymerase II subunit A C-terminal domain phosphatase SSU72